MRPPPSPRRRLTPIIAAASLLLACTLAALKNRPFVLGYHHGISFRESGGEGDNSTNYWLGSLPGRLMLVAEQTHSAYPNNLPIETPTQTSSHSDWYCHQLTPAQGFVPDIDPTTYPTTLGFALADREFYLSSHTRIHYQTLVLPRTLIFMATLVLPATLFRRSLTDRSRRRRGICTHCAYDLRASSTRCPECGQKRRRPSTTKPVS